MQNGMLPVVLSEDEVDTLMARALRQDGYRITIDLESQRVTDESGFSGRFDIDEYRKDSLLKGLDDIGRTLELEDDIAAFEASRSAVGVG